MKISLIHGDGQQKKVDLVVIGDGYKSSELDNYAKKVKEAIDYMFTSLKSRPYPRYKNFINVWRIDLESPQSGIDDPKANLWVNTPLDGHKGCIDYQIKQLCQVDWNKTHDSIDVITATKGIKPEWFLVFLNTDDATAAAHGPSRGPLPVLGTQVKDWSTRQLDIVLHEAGHAWHGLADEYHYSDGNKYTSAELHEINVSTDAKGLKWAHWLGYQAKDMSIVGAYEGGQYFQFGKWKPTQGSKMDGGGIYDCHNMKNECGHHAIATEKIVLDIHRIASQVLDSPPIGQVVQDSVLLKLADTTVSKVDWYLGGILQQGKGSVFYDSKLKPGSYALKAIVYDEAIKHSRSNNAKPNPLDLVRHNENQLLDTLNWNLEITKIPVAIAKSGRFQKIVRSKIPEYDARGKKLQETSSLMRFNTQE